MDDALKVNGKKVSCPQCDELITVGNICGFHIDRACADCCGCP